MFRLIETITAEELSPDAEQHLVRVRDGVRLATDVYLPSSPRRHPAVLVRTPYDKASRYTGLKDIARYFTDRGYVFIAQDVRGKYRSEGETTPYAFDVADAYDTLEWITRQPWSDQGVGLMGASYYGYTVWAGVASGHPAVKAAVPQVTGIDMGASHVGSLWRQAPPLLLGFNDLIQIWTDSNDYLVELDYTHRPMRDVYEAAKAVLGPCASVEGLFERSRTGDFYNPYGDRHPYQTTSIPILHWVHWFDPGLMPAGMTDYRRFRSLNGRRDLHYLRADSADHGGYRLEHLGLGDAANPYLNDEAQTAVHAAESAAIIEFFDACLKGGLREIPRARWHLGHAGWQVSGEWPPPGVTPQTMFLSHPGTGQGPGAGRLTQSAEAGRRVVEWMHDPADPVPSTTSCEENWTFLAADPDDRALRDRADVLSFRTDPLTGPVDIAGRGQARLNVEFSSATSHLCCVLHDIFPDGRVLPVAHGAVFVDARARDEYLLVDLDPIAYRFQPGHQIQLQVTSSDLPWVLPHPGTEENPWFAKTVLATRQRLSCGGSAPSSLTLPVVASTNERS